MITSVPFLIITLLVYLFVPQLRNMHGKLLVCNLSGLAIAYSCLAWLKFNGHDYIEENKCKSMGRLIYFSLLSAFCWSNVISYDLHHNFR